MTAMFPDSGVPAAEAKNTILDPDTLHCNELWYSTSRCQPRFDPAAANAVLAELINLINCAGIPYDCSKLDNLCSAVGYLIQGGDANCLTLTGGTLDYTGDLHPPLLAYPTDCCMMLKAIPNVTNSGPVRVNVNAKGFVQVVRNDGQQLHAGDWMAGVPTIIIYCGGKFIVPYMVPSQVPILATGVDVWIRTDGNDVTGDGSANSADKAFRTINGAWAKVANRYAQSPSLTINLRLGIPGAYEGGRIGPFSGQVALIGDRSNKGSYVVKNNPDPSTRCNFGCAAAFANVYGVTMALDQNYAFATCLAVGGICNMVLWDVDFICTVVQSTGNGAGFIYCLGQLDMVGTCNFNGNGVELGFFWLALQGGKIIVTSGGGQNRTALNFQSATISGASWMANTLSNISLGQNLALWGAPNVTVTFSGVTGVKYSATTLCRISADGQPVPGTIAGTVADGSYFYP